MYIHIAEHEFFMNNMLNSVVSMSFKIAKEYLIEICFVFECFSFIASLLFDLFLFLEVFGFLFVIHTFEKSFSIFLEFIEVFPFKYRFLRIFFVYLTIFDSNLSMHVFKFIFNHNLFFLQAGLQIFGAFDYFTFDQTWIEFVYFLDWFKETAFHQLFDDFIYTNWLL